MGGDMSFFWQNVDSAPLISKDVTHASSTDILRKMSELLNTSFVPRLNFKETAEGYHLEVDLPGVTKEDLEVVIKGDFLVIRGEKKMISDQEGQYYRKERLNGSFYRAVPMPKDIDKDQINAELRDGVLLVDIGKSENINHAEKRISIS